LWNGYDEAKVAAIRTEEAHEKLPILLNDPVPEVRAAAVFALGRLIGDVDRNDFFVQVENSIALSLVQVTSDSSPLVRKELVIALSALVSQSESEFRTTAAELWDEEQRKESAKVEKRSSSGPVPALARTPDRKPSQTPQTSQALSVYQCVWKVLLNLSVDPFPDVALAAQNVVDAVNIHIMNIHATLTPQQVSKAQQGGSINMRKNTSLKNLLTISSSASGENITIPATTGGGTPTSAAAAGARPSSPMPLKRRQSLRVPKVPLESSYFEWCFNRPFTEKAQATDPGSARFQEQLWKSRRNEGVIRESKPALRRAALHRFEDQIAQLENETDVISLVKFHPFERHLFVADEADHVSVWDIDEGRRISKIYNQNPVGTRLTSLDIINPKDQNLLLVGSDEGVIRVWKDYDTRGDVRLVTSWRALTDLLPSSRGSGLITEWQQSHGILLVSGDVRVIRVWDAAKELCTQDIPTVSDSCVTSLTSNRALGNLIAAGCGDGIIRLYDRRLSSRDSMIMTLAEHKAWVVGCQLQQETGEVITASVAGDVRFWDLRTANSFRTIDTHGPLSALAVHERAPVLATGSNHQYIKIYSHEGENLNTIRYHDGFLGQRIGPVSSMTFHPHKLLLAAGSTDSIVSCFA